LIPTIQQYTEDDIHVCSRYPETRNKSKGKLSPKYNNPSQTIMLRQNKNHDILTNCSQRIAVEQQEKHNGSTGKSTLRSILALLLYHQSYMETVAEIKNKTGPRKYMQRRDYICIYSRTLL
jgi:hypothetical protein